jgi:phosphoribosylformylglycinamidine synthase
VYEQYDSQVGTNTVARADGDAAVLRLKELPGKGIAVTTDCNSRYVYLNPYVGAAIAVAEAARNCVCVGAEPVAITNCLNFGNPYDPEVYWQFAEAIRGMGDMCRLLNTPVTGGNVSFHNESQHNAIFPTPTIGMLGLIDDLEATVGGRFTGEGNNVVLLGWQREELGGSEFLKVIRKRVMGDVHLDFDHEVNLQRLVLRAIRERVVSAAHDCAEGGLAVTLAEMCFGGVGLHASIPFEHTAGHLFGEAQSRVIVEASDEQLPLLVAMCEEDGVPHRVLGRTGGNRLRLDGLVDESVEDLQAVYEGALPAILEANYANV